MQVRFKTTEYSPELGDFKEGEVRDISEDIASIFISRGQAEAVKTRKEQPVRTVDKEAGANG